LFDKNLRIIVEHLLATLVILVGLGVVHWLGHVILADGLLLTIFIGIDEITLVGVSLWFVRNLAVNLWNNRERLRGTNVVLA
jgi:hypothetical protein